MMKKLITTVLLFTCMQSFAQYIAIPDSNFGIWLYDSGYSVCLTSNTNNGNWQLDTTCPAVLNTHSLDLSSQTFDMTGIYYFKNLDTLRTSLSITSTTLPPCPVKLKYLEISQSSSISNIPALPDSLMWLKLIYSLNDTFPSIMPVNLLGFDAQSSGLSILPNFSSKLRYLNLLNSLGLLQTPHNLPDSLRYFNCSNCGIDTLVAIPPYMDTLIVDATRLTYLPPLPATIIYLDCAACRLDSLPAPLPAALKYLDCSGNGGGNSTQSFGLPALPAGLEYLDCSDNNYLTHGLPALPASLVYLDCSTNSNLITLPALPVTLKHLACNSDSLTLLPALPSLTYLSCNTNFIHTLPTLPATLTYLDFSYNSISMLPYIPAGVTYLNGSNNLLPSLPLLPAGLTYLNCSSNLLSILPQLPALLQFLYCNNNNLTALPVLTPHLNTLDCSHNPNLLVLPVLNDSLGTLKCDSDNLTVLQRLDNLHGLVYLSCAYNHLTYLPAFPDTLSYLNCRFNPNISCLPPMPGLVSDIRNSYINRLGFYIAGTNIHCLPNQFPVLLGSYDINPQTLPLCAPNSGCAFYYNISGNVHSDTAATCNADSLAPGNSLGNIKVNLLQGGQVVQQCYVSSYFGEYSFKTDSFTNYTVQVDTANIVGLAPACPQSGLINLAITNADSVSINNNFGLACSSFDVGVLYVYGHFRPGFTRVVSVLAGNLAYLRYNANCGVRTSGTMQIILSGPVHYVSPVANALTPAYVSASGDTLVYNIADWDSITLNSFNINVLTDSSAVLGSSVCITGIVTPAVPDANPSNDTLTQCFTVTNSVDPNNKAVYPATLTPNGGWLTYTIEFQNTGSDTAYTVVVKDTLSRYVDASSFQYIASDHKAVTQVFGNVVVFTFPRINLVDSAANPPLSTGWVQYKVKAKPNLPLNTQVKNTAYVYFDINPAIITNTIVTTIDTPVAPLGITPVTTASTMRLYPNPNKGSFTLQTSNCTGSNYTITNMLGEVLVQQQITADRQAVYLPQTAEGVYTISVKGTQPLRFTVVR